jgi:hypothetical protein
MAIPKRLLVVLSCLVVAISSVPGVANGDDRRGGDIAAGARGPADSVVLLIRHAEKPVAGPGLAPAGELRAEAYVRYFGNFRVDGTPTKIQTLVATADSAYSSRPRLTLAPLGQALGLPIQQPFANEDTGKFAAWLASAPRDRTTLVAWHHGKLPKLLASLGADPAALLPHGSWPDDVYDWVIALRFDARGRLVTARRIVEPAFPSSARG